MTADPGWRTLAADWLEARAGTCYPLHEYPPDAASTGAAARHALVNAAAALREEAGDT